METTTLSPVKFTDSAVEEVRRLMNDPSFSPTKKLRVGVKGGGCTGLSYVLEFDEQKPGDQEYDYNGLSFIMDKSHELYLYGMEVNWEGGLNSRGFTFNNPNASSTCGCGSSFAV